MEFKRFNKTILDKNQVPVEVLIVIEVEEDDIHPKDDFDFGNAEDNAEYLQRFERGELFIGVISVKAYALGFEASDYLGACHLHCNNMFNSKPFEDDVNNTISEHGMIDTAIEALKLELEIVSARDRLGHLNF